VGDPTTAAVRRAGDDLAATLAAFRAAHGFGRAIAAPQIGWSARCVALSLDGRSFRIHDPVITRRSRETVTLWDDCMSFPDLLVRVERHTAVDVRYLDERGEVVDWSIERPDVAELLQHEIDHLDGVLAVDRATDRDALVDRVEFERDPERFRARVDLRPGPGAP
ncbi:MAG: peptide deformylase, partial [Planctomycetota bacterium JB042]